MSQHRGAAAAGLTLAAALLSGCTVAPAVTALPGQGKSYADYVRDDSICRGAAPAATSSAAAVTPTAARPANYYQCMAARGELVVPNRPVAYPAYAAYPYPAYAYAPYGPYGYPYGPYYGGVYPAIGFGVGFGYFGGGWGGWRGGWHEGFHGDGFRGGGFHGEGGHDGGFHGGGRR